MALAAASLATIVVALAAMAVILVSRTSPVQKERNGAVLDNRATNQNGASATPETSNHDAHQTIPLREQPQNGKKPDTRIETRARRTVRPTGRQEPDAGKPYPELGTIVIVIDDAGYNMKQLRPFLDLPFPLTIAVLPGLPHSEEAARAAAASGKEVILHQPMEAIGGENPGPGAIYRSMSRQDVFDTMERNLATVPGAVGINNHMGSLVTQDLYLMEAVATVAKKHGIYYLDSLTVSGTVMPEAARREGIHYWERSVFLDNSSDRVSIIRAVEDGKKRAQANRPAVMIGHVWSAELAQTLAELYPKLIEEGYSLSTISRFMMHEASGNDADPGD
jgi:hypothetical protein